MNENLTPTEKSANLCFLLVDDNDIDNYVHEKTLKHFGQYECKVFNSSYAGLEHLRQTKMRYDYIILDIYMPEMDGFSFVEHFNRLGLNLKHGPVLFLTASLNPIDRLKAETMGLAFLEKPLKMEFFFNLKKSNRGGPVPNDNAS